MHHDKIFTKEFLEEEFVRNGLNKTEIARKYKACPQTVLKYLRKHCVVRAAARSRRTEDMTGRTYGRLTVLEYSGVDAHHKAQWLCACECGNQKVVNAASLKRCLATSCGCFRAEMRHKGYQDISVSYWRRVAESAEARGLDFDITPEYVWDIYESQGRKCAYTGIPVFFCRDYNKVHLFSASIDRRDSFEGYVHGNIQIVHKIVNRCKAWYPENEFLAMCNMIARHRPMSSEDCDANFNRVICNKPASRDIDAPIPGDRSKPACPGQP